MIEELSQSNTSEESRNVKIAKKRVMRKAKVITRLQQDGVLQSCTTREDRARIQKIKNREAAQRSRDTHKEYVSYLEGEVKRLSLVVEKNGQLCSRCHAELSCQLKPCKAGGEHSEREEILSQFIADETVSIDKVKNAQQQDYSRMDDWADIDRYFQRVETGSASQSAIKCLFICMIAIAIMLSGQPSKGNTESNIPVFDAIPFVSLRRDLMEIARQTEKKTQTENQIARLPRRKKALPLQNTSLVAKAGSSLSAIVTQPFGPLDNQDCLRSLINIDNTILPQHPPSTIYSLLQNSPSLSSQTDVLLCHSPKLYRSKPRASLLSHMIEIIMSGSEIIEIIGSAQKMWYQPLLKFEGLYKISAQVKEIAKVQDRNCIS